MEAAVKKFVRKPFYVDAVEVTSQSLVEAAKWCSGEIRDDADRRVETELVESMVEGAAKLHIYVRVQIPGVDEPVDRSTVPMPTPEERAAERTGAQGPEEV